MVIRSTGTKRLILQAGGGGAGSAGENAVLGTGGTGGAGLAFNIIGITKNRLQDNEYCKILINPRIVEYMEDLVETTSNCGSITLDKPIKLTRNSEIIVNYFDEKGNEFVELFTRETGAFTIQHEVDHNNGILIIDYK
jgi:peptide deformylase